MEVTTDNFEDVFLPVFKEQIRSCAFVAIDAEYTALRTKPEQRTSLFDGPSDYYRCERSVAADSIINQMGLAVFHFNPANHSYTVQDYNIYIFPNTLGPLDQSFVCSPSALKFLSKNNFNFNKFVSKGIGYMTRTQEARLRSELKETNALSLLDVTEQEAVQEILSQLGAWVRSPQRTEGDSATFQVPGGRLLGLIAQREAGRAFKNVEARSSPTDECLSVIYRDSSLPRDSNADEALISHLQGFSKVIRLLMDAQKPLVGHNCFLDILKIHHHFLDPLPETYPEFKERIRGNFPAVWDTKHMAFDILRRLEKENSPLSEAFLSTNLHKLYLALNNKTGGNFKLSYTPDITHTKGFDKYGSADTFCHEAGFDAFMTGVVFLREAHMSAALKILSLRTIKPLTWNYHLNGIKMYQNQVNISRANVRFMNLGGKDPPSIRPQNLLVSFNGERVVDPLQIAGELSGFGAVVDVRESVSRGGRKKLYVAISSERAANKILDAFKKKPGARFWVSRVRPSVFDSLTEKKLAICTIAVSAIGLIGLGTVILMRK